MTIQAIAFDAYGTLFDVYSIGELAEKLFPKHGAALAELWRDKQIEYTRLRTLCSTYKPFWEVTQDALVFSCKKLGLDLSLDAQNSLMGCLRRDLVRLHHLLGQPGKCTAGRTRRDAGCDRSGHERTPAMRAAATKRNMTACSCPPTTR